MIVGLIERFTYYARSTMHQLLRGLFSLIFIGAGVMHFVRPDPYVAIVPPYLPAALVLVYVSGVAEIGLGVALWIPSLRRWAAWGLIALLIAVFPANIHMAMANIGGYGIWSWVRLPFQPLLIAWAYVYTRNRS